MKYYCYYWGVTGVLIKKGGGVGRELAVTVLVK